MMGVISPSISRLSAVANLGFLYPGINIDLRHRIDVRRSPFPREWPANAFYPVAISGESASVITPVLQIREVAMMILMDKLTDKDRWYDKIHDPAVVGKWRREAREQSEEGLFERIMQEKERYSIPLPRTRIISDAAFEFCVSELKNKARYFKQTGLIPTLDTAGNTVVKSDSLVSEELHADLSRAFRRLQADHSANVDWQPWSNEMQQNLVHPSMYPLVYGRSRFIQEEVVSVDNALRAFGQGTVTASHPAAPEVKDNKYWYQYSLGSGEIEPEYWSHNFQWLPANIAFREDGTARFTSYINSLHPKKYPEIYGTLERLVDTVIPAWDQCLREECRYGHATVVAGRSTTRFEHITEASDSNEALWEPFDVEYWKRSNLQLTTEQLRDLDQEYHTERYGFNDAEAQEARKKLEEAKRRREDQGLPQLPWPNLTEEDIAREKWRLFRNPIYPEPKPFDEVDYTPRQSIRDMFRDHGLQIIVKMASVELNPEKPVFPWGNWHVEGQMNERICATALYYVDCENVTPSHLSFRTQTDTYLSDDMKADQDEYNWLERVHGTSLGPSGESLQNFGDVETRQGRVLVFPNTFHHRVSQFRLKDATKPGHRRFIALWLVDPHQRIVSTANVPPQQKQWWEEEREAGTFRYGREEAPGGLMTAEEAKEYRLRLMEERSERKKKADGSWGFPYNFCEH